jgi:octaprenyl-diphosphate synthase
MDKLQIIAQPVQKEIKAFNKLYMENLHPGNKDFQSMIDFVLKKNGKQIRPLILLLSAKLCGETTPQSLDYAVILELLHIATLIHDDVVDNTMERRGQLSVNAQYDNKAAVLLGDYILSQAIIAGVKSENIRVLTIMANLAQNLAEGELTQLISSNEIIVDEKRYFEIIWKKTAILLSSCSELGAISVNASDEKVEILRLIGENLGICFQIRDDIFDYFEQGEIGKPTGNDIREGKITLPLIHALNKAPKEKSEKMMSIIKNKSFSSRNIEKLIVFAKEYDGVQYAQTKMQEIKEKTLVLLNNFPDSETKTAMITLINYIIEREK